MFKTTTNYPIYFHFCVDFFGAQNLQTMLIEQYEYDVKSLFINAYFLNPFPLCQRKLKYEVKNNTREEKRWSRRWRLIGYRLIYILADIFAMITYFSDLAQARGVCRKWKDGVEMSIGRRKSLSFAGWKMKDDSTARLIRHEHSLRELDFSRSHWGCQITDHGLNQISLAKCIPNLKSISLWGMVGITDKGVVQLISRANSLQNLNIGGTYITDIPLLAIANNCPNLKVINYILNNLLPSSMISA
ncbi:hypothetical protein IC582_024936 [Cucumis melo]